MIASAGPEAYRRGAEALLTADEVDALVVIYTPVGIFETAEIGPAVGEAARAAAEAGAGAKPILGTVLEEGGETEAQGLGPGREIPIYPFPEEIGRVLGKIIRHADWRRSDPGVFAVFGDQDLERTRAIARAALDARGPGWLSVQETRALLQAAGMRLPAGGVATDAETAARLADQIGYPVAVKLASVEVVHKTEIGGVRLGLAEPRAVRQAFDEIRQQLDDMGKVQAMEGVLVQPMLEGMAEVMIGMVHDPVFGPLLTFGLGGVHVEILRDVAFGVAPLTDVDAARIVRAVRGYRLLEGYRGHPPADVSALEATLLRISRLAEAVPEISEMDLNPIFALRPRQGYQVADARIRVEPRP